MSNLIFAQKFVSNIREWQARANELLDECPADPGAYEDEVDDAASLKERYDAMRQHLDAGVEFNLNIGEIEKLHQVDYLVTFVKYLCHHYS